MKLWQSFLGRRTSARPAGEDAGRVSDPAAGVYLFHPSEHAPDHLADAAHSLQHSAQDRVILLVDSEVPADDTLLEQFTGILTKAVRHRVEGVTLVMADGAASGLAGRITEAWPLEVVACDGTPVIGPGGTLFSPYRWLRFVPGLAPEIIGQRFPPPSWQPACSRLTADIADGHRIDQIPAGLLLRPGHWGTPPVPPLAHTLPMDINSAILLVGGPGVGAPTADAVASVLAALPAQVRTATRLVPWSGDLLPVAVEVADLLGTEVEVSSGLPLLVDSPDSDILESRTVLVRPDGEPTWEPYVESVICGPPSGPAPRLKRWRPPMHGIAPGIADGTYRLSDEWEVAVTRAGLWIGPSGEWPGTWERPIEADVLAIDLGLPTSRMTDSLVPVLDRLLARLEPGGRERALLQVHAQCSGDQVKQLRRLAVRHEIGIAPRGWIPGVPTPAAVPAAVAASAAGQRTAPALPEPAGLPAAAVAAPPSLMSSTEPSLAPAEVTHDTAARPAPAPAPAPAETTQMLALPQVNVAEPSGGAASAAALPGWLTTGGSQTGAPSTGAPQAGGPSTGAPGLGSAAPDGVPVRNGGMPGPTQATTSSPSPSPSSDVGGDSAAAGSSRVTAESALPTATPNVPDPVRAPEPVRPTALAPAPSKVAGPAAPAAPAAPVAPASPVAPAPARPAPVPVNGQGEVQNIRTALGDSWQLHHQAVQRAVTRLPSVRNRVDDAMRNDLAVVHAYVTDEAARLPYDLRRPALAAGLRLLPSYRGPAVRSAGPEGASVESLVPGVELSAADPISALAGERPLPEAGGDRYLIWSATARRIRPLLDDTSAEGPEEVVFAPQTRLRVLGTREGPGGRMVLLRELSQSAPAAGAGQLDPQDALFEERLLAWLALPATQWDPATAWPERCAGRLTERPAGDPVGAPAAPALS
ncbi:hypothetical protein ACGFYV_34810 [Streptomyces sp. NPDC048297]|uniref:hypothetical protein n=1 Tax=Streptomyces sp. NPDC048297 TaxID=3365531 RepID=UPI0037184D82